ncbi:hypothetical protein SAMN05216268_11950 [Streptomyces yunnanensis]|uniref:Uncharacterized protein n=1 Tax=Streptomyces yunnanensis TaxID=156453 RepID=A0A9X8N5J7_9ACTN|nr:hypothetical protein SAMN05216268_11950 [Streptomyces yunnanensis]
MLAAALEAEVNAYIVELADERDGKVRRPVVRNGYHQPRQVTTAAGVVEGKAPRDAPHLVALVRAGSHFERGQLIERPKPLVA